MLTARNILKRYVDTSGHVVTVIKPKRDPKRITASTKGSIKHCGKTNRLGISV